MATTVSVKVCTASRGSPLDAVMMIGWSPASAAAGVPDNTPVAALNVSHAGSGAPPGPVAVRAGAGAPAAVTVWLNAVPERNESTAGGGLVIDGATGSAAASPARTASTYQPGSTTEKSLPRSKRKATWVTGRPARLGARSTVTS